MHTEGRGLHAWGLQLHAGGGGAAPGVCASERTCYVLLGVGEEGVGLGRRLLQDALELRSVRQAAKAWWVGEGRSRGRNGRQSEASKGEKLKTGSHYKSCSNGECRGQQRHQAKTGAAAACCLQPAAFTHRA